MKLFDRLSVKYIWEKLHPSVIVWRHEKKREEINLITTKLPIKNEFRQALQMTSGHK